MMLRTLSALLLTLACLTTTAYCEDDFDGFSFPEFDSELAAEPAAPTQNRIQAPAQSTTPFAASQTDLQSQQEVPAGKLTAAAIAMHNNANHTNFPAASYSAYGAGVPSGYALGPSGPSPLLSYMQCNQTACANVWQGFGDQHRADMANYCHAGNDPSRCSSLYDTPCAAAPLSCRYCGLQRGCHCNRYANPTAATGCDCH